MDLDTFVPAAPSDTEVPAAAQAILDAIGPRACLIVDGTSVGPVADGITMGLDEFGEVVGEPDALVTLNAAYAQLLTLQVERGRVLAEPIVILHKLEEIGRASCRERV